MSFLSCVTCTSVPATSSERRKSHQHQRGPRDIWLQTEGFLLRKGSLPIRRSLLLSSLAALSHRRGMRPDKTRATPQHYS